MQDTELSQYKSLGTATYVYQNVTHSASVLRSGCLLERDTGELFANALVWSLAVQLRAKPNGTYLWSLLRHPTACTDSYVPTEHEISGHVVMLRQALSLRSTNHHFDLLHTL